VTRFKSSHSENIKTYSAFGGKLTNPYVKLSTYGSDFQPGFRVTLGFRDLSVVSKK